MTKYMLDNCVLSSFARVAEKLQNDSDSYFITSVQASETDNFKNTKEVIRRYVGLVTVDAGKLPILGRVDETKVGDAYVGPDETFTRIFNYMDEHEQDKSKKNGNDALIGAASMRESCTLVSEDNNFVNAVNFAGGTAIKWDEFKARKGL